MVRTANACFDVAAKFGFQCYVLIIFANVGKYIFDTDKGNILIGFYAYISFSVFIVNDATAIAGMQALKKLDDMTQMLPNSSTRKMY